jgi:hypothetical protein
LKLKIQRGRGKWLTRIARIWDWGWERHSRDFRVAWQAEGCLRATACPAWLMGSAIGDRGGHTNQNRWPGVFIKS